MERVEGSRLAPEQIVVRCCHALAEFDACVELQRLTWGESIVVPSAMFVVAHETGGQVLGAFAGTRLLGFTLALVGVHGAAPFLHSHMTAVLPDCQNKGVGRQLKLFQRQDALQRGFSLVEWTFDPLEPRNAHLNLVRLGVVARKYLPNLYGITDSPLHARMPTDRLLAEWWLESPRVRRVIEGREQAEPPSADAPCVTFPADIAERKRADPREGAHVQNRIREEFQAWFSRGYAATRFQVRGDVAEYLLQPIARLGSDAFPRLAGEL